MQIVNVPNAKKKNVVGEIATVMNSERNTKRDYLYL
jgi:hypothetical protein